MAELSKPAPWKSYLVVLAAVAAALVARFALDPYLGNQIPYVTFFVAVTVVAWYEGLGPTLVAIMAGACLSDYFFLPPRHSFAIAGTANLVGFGTYFMVTLPIAFLAQRQKRDAAARMKAEEQLSREEVLRESEEQFRTLANAIPQLCWMANPDGWVFWYNQRWYEYSGTTPVQMEGWGWQSVHSPETLPKVLEQWKASIATGEPFEMVFPLRGGDGLFRPFLTRVMPVKDAEGKVVRWFGTNTDIREQQEATELRRHSEERYRSLFENMSEGCALCEMVFDDANRPVDFVYLQVNAAFSIITGLKDVVGKKVSEVIPGTGETHPELLEAYARVARGSQAERFEIEFKPLGIWLAISAYCPKKDHFVAVFDNITERKQAEEKLRESEERFRSVVENMSEGLMFFDAKGNVIYQNPSSLCIHGLEAKADEPLEGELLKATWKGWDEKGRPLSPDEWPMSRVLREGRFQNQVLHAQQVETGHEFDASYNGSPLRDSAGNLTGAFITIQDITERKQAEDALRQSEQRYSALFANKINAIAHCRVISDEHGQPVDYRILKINDAYERIIGIKKAHIEGRRVKEVFPGFEHYAFDYIGVLGKVGLEGGEIMSETFFDATGQSYSVYAYSPVPGEFTAIFTDITERKRAEAALRESEERLRLFIEHAPAALAMFDTEMRYVSVSRRWLADYGLGDRNVHGVSHYEVFPEVSDQWKSVHRRGLAGEVQRKDADSFVRADGSVQRLRWEVRPWYDARGEVGGIVIFSEDITERKRAEEAVHVSEGRLAAVIENLTEGLIIGDENGRVFFWNPAALAMFGYASLEECQRKLAEFADTFEVRPLDEDRLLQVADWPMSRVLRGEMLRDSQVRLFRPDQGWEKILAYSGWLIHSASGEMLAFVSIMDITERKRVEEALQEGRATLDAAMASMTDAVFISDVTGKFINFNDAFAVFHRFKNKRECAEMLSEYGSRFGAANGDGHLSLPRLPTSGECVYDRSCFEVHVGHAADEKEDGFGTGSAVAAGW